MIDEATELLIGELKLPPIQNIEVVHGEKESSVNAFSVKLSNLSGRADASYHIPVVNSIIKILNENAGEVTTVGNEQISKDVVLPGRFKRVYFQGLCYW